MKLILSIGILLPFELMAGTAGSGAMAIQESGIERPRSAVGQVGERQTSEDVSPNVKPTARIESRVANRVRSRIRNRLDRFYDPEANAASPFADASEQARLTGRPTRR